MPALRLPALAALTAAAPILGLQAQQARTPAPRTPITGTITSVTIQQRMIIRVPRLPVGRSPLANAASALPPIRWVEKKTDKCVPLINLAAASIAGPDSVDLLLNGGKRLRARFDAECPALDFYSGFYLKMTRDGKVCSGRDSVRARSGGECQIKSFRSLVPAK